VSADFDPKKDAVNIRKHGVSRSEGDGVLNDPLALTVEDDTTGKTRITIYMDDAVLKRFKAQSEKSGRGYQTLINEALNSYLGLTEQPITQELVRKIVRVELAVHG